MRRSETTSPGCSTNWKHCQSRKTAAKSLVNPLLVPEIDERIARLSPAKRELLERKLRLRDDEVARASCIPRRQDRETAPLSFAQERLYFLYRLDPQSSAYNVPRAIRIRGSLDTAALVKTLDELFRRHEVLRSRFVEVDGTVLATIDPPAPLRLEVEPVRGSTSEERDREARRMAHAEAERPFDLGRGPILRARLLELASDHHVLVLTNHHIVSDAWSAGVLFGELSELYSAFLTGGSSPLPELEIQYGDFSAWQRGWLQGEMLREQLAYWRAQLRGAPAFLELATDVPRPALQTFVGAIETFSISPALSDSLRELSRREDATLFMALLAAVQSLLSRYTGQTDIVVGTPIASRNRPELEGLMGFFINSLALRTDLSGSPSFRQILGRVREVAVGAYANQDVPFEKLVEDLHPDRDLARNAIFQAMIALKNTPSNEIEWPGLEVEHLDVGRRSSKFDLSVFFEETPDGLTGAIEYATDLFERDTIRRMIGHLQELLAGVVANPDAVVETIPILRPHERRELDSWNATSADFPADACLHELFELQAARSPESVALIDSSREVTYRQLNEQANRLARYLRRKGVEPGSIVGACLERSARTVAALLAVLKAGAAYVPLDPSYPPERISFMIRDSGACLLLVDEPPPAVPGTQTIPLIDLTRIDRELASEGERNFLSGATPLDLAYVIYTSGSTGAPKGVEAIHRASVNRFAWMWREYPFAEGEISCQKTTLSFVDSIWETFGPLLQGIPAVVLSSEAVRDPGALVDRLAEAGVSRIVLVPSLLKVLLESGLPLAERLSRLKWWVTSGETLPLDLFRRFRAAMPDAVLVNLYGSSEVSADVTFWDSRMGEPRHSVPIGRPISNMQVHVLDPRRQRVPVGIPGEIYVGGVGLARGYRNREDLTAERFVRDPFGGVDARLFKTGDRARFRADGQLEYLGRNDDQVKVRGYRIELGEIESALREHPAVKVAVAAVRQDSTGEPRLIAYVVPEENQSPGALVLRPFLESRLPAFMVPAAFVHLAALPLTPSGKVDRKALPDAESIRPELTRQFVPPATRTEEAFTKTWQDVLKLDRVGIDDDFFELGGHSLLLIQVSSRIRASLGVEVPLRSFFEMPTVRQLAGLIDERETALQPSAPIPRSLAGSSLPLSFAQRRLWLIEQIDPGNTAYLIRRVYRLSGPLRPETLQRAIQAVVARHASLRTRFVGSGEEPRQEVVAEGDLDFALEFADLSALPPVEREAEVTRRAEMEAYRPFDLSVAPLVRASLSRVGPEEHALVVTLHHLVGDGWSLGILFREVSAFYRAALEGRSATLPPLPIQYPDFAAWQRNWMSGEVLERQLGYWRSEIAGIPEVAELPADRPRPPRRSSAGERRPLRFSPAIADALKTLGRRHESTLFMTLLACYAALLAQSTAQEDLMIGSPIAGRNRLETESLIGLFLNTLVMRARLAGDPTFSELLGRVRNAALGAYAHQDLPFEKLVDELRPSRSLAYNPIFQIWFVLQNAPSAAWDLPGIRATPIPPPAIQVRHDVQLTMWESDGGLEGSLDFSADLFDSSTMDSLAHEFGVVVEAVTSDPRIRLSGIRELLKRNRHERAADRDGQLEQVRTTSLKSSRRKAIRG
ncbi:MAG: amino acid adenylation domain-containing protein [Acidobacteriota bacterium]